MIKLTKKYYTPKIEEFCVGFKYQVNALEGINDDGTEVRKWTETFIDDNIHHLFSETKRLKEEPHNIRVKYLDRKDIESLGFVYDEENSRYEIDLSNIMYTRIFRLYHRKRTFTRKSIVSLYDLTDNAIFHRLEINNISELEKIIKKSNIKWE